MQNRYCIDFGVPGLSLVFLFFSFIWSLANLCNRSFFFSSFQGPYEAGAVEATSFESLSDQVI